ncbi:MAG: 30S ribosomal protein S6 [Candidatus Omnitrophica bacterium]|nr:30S ribosomal protein S6 [Candidatus Omnitrophota bacterium]
MEKNELLRKYELVVIVDSRLSEEEKDGVVKEVTGYISKNGGNVVNSKVWLDKQKFTFEIKKKTEGTYYLINFESDGQGIDKIQGALRLHDKVLRSSILVVEQFATN